MTDSSGPSDAPPRRLDDPAWVDDIVATAVARVTGTGARGGEDLVAEETSVPSAPSETRARTQAVPPKNGIPKPSGPGKRIVARPRKAVAKAPSDTGSVITDPAGAPASTEAPRPLPPSLAVAPSAETDVRTSRSNGSSPRVEVATSPSAVATAPVSTLVVADPAPEAENQLVPDDELDPDREPDDVERHSSPARGLLEWVVVIGGALLVAVLIKTFLFQAFYIPSGSMLPTLQIDDRVLVNKLSYDLHDVNRGDLVVFERPADGDPTGIDDLIKRVIGLPGDTVEVRDSVVYINGGALEEPYLPTGVDFGDSPPVVVPDDHVFVMGDNRTNSRDSRVFGAVPVDDIVGRAFFRIWPLTNLGFL